jgi:dihydrofolate synthase/folylpolyglutamate synthase
MSLQSFLNKKPLYYSEIDYGRMPRIYKKIRFNFASTKIIHLIGTNGKGTTGRFLSCALFNIGYKTAHYTSPHIFEFNERIWINGSNVSDKSLEVAHEKLQTILSPEDSDALSYFEYTTFLAMLMFNDCDYIILEAGLGGEYDATAVFDKLLTLVTPIDYDHEAFLGSDIKSITKTKLNSIQNKAIMVKQKYDDIYVVADEIQNSKKIKIYSVDDFLKDNDLKKISQISKKLSLALYLKENLKLCISALNLLNIEYRVDDFNDSKLFGRLTKIGDNILLDVGHNPLAALWIAKSLEGAKYTLIYNTYKDKNYQKVIEILKDIISDVEIIDIQDDRIVPKIQLYETLTHLGIKYTTFNQIKIDKNYLVFGSFKVVEEFLKVYNG